MSATHNSSPTAWTGNNSIVDDSVDGNNNDGDSADGNNNDADSADGNNNDDDNADGNNNDDDNADGNNNDGDNADGNNNDDDNADGNNNDGDNADGNNNDDDNADGNNNDGDNADGNTNEDADGVPVDRGWAWVVVAACFGMHVLVFGGVKSFGVLFMELKDKYHVTAGELGMIQGITMAIMLGLSLGANLLAVRFTCQKIVFIGGVLSGLGLVLSTFVQSFDLLYLTVAGITGLGYALSYSPCVVIVGLHFKRRRSLANGISISGSGVGAFVLPNLVQWLLNEYGLSGCLLLLGGLTLNVCVCALLIRPLNSYKKRQRPENRHKNAAMNKDTGWQTLLTDCKDKTTFPVYERESNTQIYECTDNNNGHPPRKDSLMSYLELANNGIMPMASLQNIPQEALENITSSLCYRCKCCPRPTSATNRGQKKTQKLFDTTLLRNPLFIIYALSCGFGNFAYPNIFVMLPAHAETNGLDRNTAALLVSVVGITDLIGRLFFGWFSDLKLLPRRYWFVGCMAISALLNLLAPAMTTFPALVTYAALYGLFAGSYTSLILVVLADVLGVEKLSNAYGLVMLVMAMGLLPGPLICGGLRDVTGSWDYSFILCGVLAIIGSIPPLFEPCAQQYVNAREEKKMKNTALNINRV